MPAFKIKSGDLFGISPPSLFVGRYGYPRVYAGPLVSGDADTALSDTASLYGKGLDYILSHTSSLIRVASKIDVKHPYSKMVEATQEISLSVKPLDTEVKVEKININPTMDSYFHPTGPRVLARRVDVVDNPSIPKRVDMTVDEGMKATRAIIELYRYGFSVDYIQRILSAGVLGMNNNRKIVPTRWSITTVDDVIGKALLKDIRYYENVGEIEYYFNEYMGNEFHIFLIPGMWEYEMIESWLRGALYSPNATVSGEDYEPYEGRKKYAANITGAYYSARLAVAEHLYKRKRQARVLIYREIRPDYKIPLGVWVIREIVRNAFANKPRRFASMEMALGESKKRVAVVRWPEKSKILYNMKHQRKLEDFYFQNVNKT